MTPFVLADRPVLDGTGSTPSTANVASVAMMGRAHDGPLGSGR